MTVEYAPSPRPVSRMMASYLSGSLSAAEIVYRVLRGWPFVLIGALLGFLMGAVTLINSEPSYTAKLSLLPADNNGTGGVAEGGGALDLLANLAGFGGGSIPKFARFAAAMTTPGVAKLLDERYHMVCRAFPKQCDMKTGQWHDLTGWSANMAAAMARLSHVPNPNGRKTTTDLSELIGSSVILQTDQKSRLVNVSFSDPNREFASFFLLKVVEAANDYIKMQDRAVSQQYRNYLSQQLANPNINLSEREALMNLLVQQERSLMLTGVKLPYAAISMDAPVVSVSSGAARALSVFSLMGMILGAMAAVFFALMPDRIKFWRGYWKGF